MAFNYTEAQDKAIHTQGKNLLVSAGAGSGKTAVLTERVTQKIIAGIPIESLVVLTFTNAAAKEMKQRIRHKLQNEQTNPHVKKALTALDSAHINTFDGFALFILRKYGYHIDISPAVRIGDAVKLKVIKKRILEHLFNDYYERQDSAFTAYVKAYEIKDDKMLKAHLMGYYERLMLHADHDEMLDRYESTREDEQRFKSHFESFLTLIRENKEAYQSTLYDLKSQTKTQEGQAYVDTLIQQSEPFLNAEDYQTMFETVQALVSLPDLRSLSRQMKKIDATDEYDIIKSTKKTLSNMAEAMIEDTFTLTKSDHFEAYKKSQKHVPIIIEILRKMIHAIRAYQVEHETMDFIMVANLALNIIKTQPHVRNELKETIHELMVDEYQDTNPMQEAFIDAITDNNVYRVGDVKQSIYRFRHAEPALFTQKYRLYKTTNEGQNIDLDTNYRSRKPLISAINTVFKGIMDENIGGVDYEGGQMLTYGLKAYDALSDTLHAYGLRLHLYQKEPIKSYLDDKVLTTYEMETFHIVQDIKAKVGRFDVYDKETKAFRKAQYSDFAILLSASTLFEQIKQIFEYHSIPLHIYKSEPFINYDDIDVIRHLFKAIYALTNPDYYSDYFKHSFLSLARSYAFDMNDDDTVQQALAIPGSLSRSTSWVMPVFKPMIDSLYAFAKDAEYMALDDLFEAMIERFNLVEKINHLDHTEAARARLNYMQLLIKQYAAEGMLLETLIDTFDEIIESSLDVEFDTSLKEAGNQVKLMTIHKSKGLEFPVVYLPHADRSTNRQTRPGSHFDPALGFVLEYDDEGLSKTFLHTLLSTKQHKDEVSEKIRLLYVAITRAREACIVPMLDKDQAYHFNQQGKVIPYERLKKFDLFHSMFTAMRSQLSHSIEPVDLSTANLTDAYKYEKPLKTIAKKTAVTKSYTTLDLPKTIITQGRYSTGIESLLTKDQLENVAFGNTMHAYFELIDFESAPTPQIEALTDDTTIRSMLNAFFNHPLIQGLSIQTVYKEFPFVVEEDDGSQSGYIDLLLETDDKFIIIDYKLKHIEKAHYYEQIKGYGAMLARMRDKPIEGYLYSIVEKRFLKVL